jgi:outer membrane protein
MMRRRYGWILSGALVLAVLGTAAGTAARADGLKIGYVNYARLMQESPQAKAVQTALRNEFSGKQHDLTTQQAALKTKEAQLERDGPTMTADQRAEAERELQNGNRQLSEKVNEYQDDFNARQNQELSKLQKVLVEQVQNYAQAQKFDLVLADGVIFSNPTIDITAPILAALQARGDSATPSASPAAAPKLPLKPTR